MKNDNVINELNSVLTSIPNGLNLLEKIRWVYINIGKIFSYDYLFTEFNGENYKIRFDQKFISRYVTCVQISEVLRIMIGNIDPNRIKCQIIERPKVRFKGNLNMVHKANLVTLFNGEKYILDLTQDLFLIQSGCQTREFGYSTNAGNEDIIPRRECRLMDEKLGFIKDGKYTDDLIEEEVDNVNFNNYSKMTNVGKIINQMNSVSKLMVNFRGFQEGKDYLTMLFSMMVKSEFKEFDLRNGSYMIAYYLFGSGKDTVWYRYDQNSGLNLANASEISGLLASGWVTKSKTLSQYLENAEQVEQ